MKYQNYIQIASLVFFVLSLFVGCIDEDIAESKKTSETDGVSFILQIQEAPKANNSTRAPSVEAADDSLNTICILALVEGTEEGKWNYSYMVKAQKKEKLDIRKYKYSVSLQELAVEQRFIFLGNVGDHMDVESLDPILQGKYYNDKAGADQINDENSILRYLKLNNEEIWFAEPTTGSETSLKIQEKALHIPMCSMPTVPERIDTFSVGTVLNGGNPILLLRMLARIDIENKLSKNYEFQGAYLYHRLVNGYIGHTKKAWKSDLSPEGGVTEAWENSDERTFYQDLPYPVTNNAIRRSIYTFESEKTERNLSPAIIVKIKNKVGPYAGDSSYYRIDIPEFNADGTKVTDIRGPILRNHCYTIKIDSVLDIGEGTPEEAYYGKIKIRANVVDWEEHLDSVVLGELYNLWVEHTYIKYHHKDTTTKSFDVETSHRNGFLMGYDNKNKKDGGGDFEMFTHLLPNPTGPYNNSTGFPSFDASWRHGGLDGNGKAKKVNISFKTIENENKESIWGTYAFRAGNITKYVHLHQTGTNDDWQNPLVVCDWEDVVLNGETGTMYRIDVSNDLVYLAINSSSDNRSCFALNVTGYGYNDNKSYWVVESSSPWITPMDIKQGIAAGAKYRLRFLTENSPDWFYTTDADAISNTSYVSNTGVACRPTGLRAGVQRRIGFIRLRLGNLFKVVQVVEYKKFLADVKSTDTNDTIKFDVNRNRIESAFGDLSIGRLDTLKLKLNHPDCVLKVADRTIDEQTPIRPISRPRVIKAETGSEWDWYIEYRMNLNPTAITPGYQFLYFDSSDKGGYDYSGFDSSGGHGWLIEPKNPMLTWTINR